MLYVNIIDLLGDNEEKKRNCTKLVGSLALERYGRDTEDNHFNSSFYSSHRVLF